MTRSAPNIPAVPYIAIIGAALMLALSATEIATRAALKQTPLQATGP